PEGSLSRWIGWNILGLTKTQWEQQHTIFSYLFVVFTILHIFKVNWALLWSYFFVKKLKFVNLKEIVVAIAITLFVFIGTLANINPFQFVSDAGKTISKNFGKNVDRPDISDPEKLTIDQFAHRVFKISYAEFTMVAKQYQLKVESKDQTIQEFCTINNIPPVELYKILKKNNFNLDSLD
ncbi:MAG TPA: DUF4405 domain-containing protein, partial [Bacteroidales bacterium]|nr:DUF4405 domain-containing protein [Bacteroidales bacterium]